MKEKTALSVPFTFYIEASVVCCLLSVVRCPFSDKHHTSAGRAEMDRSKSRPASAGVGNPGV